MPNVFVFLMGSGSAVLVQCEWDRVCAWGMVWGEGMIPEILS